MKNNLKQLWFALTVAYIALLPQFYLVYTAQNRYLMMWSHTQYLAILIAIFILGAGYFIGYKCGGWVARRYPKTSSLFRWLVTWVLYCILIRSLVALLFAGNVLPFSALSFLDHKLMKIGYYFVLPLIVFSWHFNGWYKRLKAVYCGLSFLLLLFLIVPWTYKTFAYGSINSLEKQNFPPHLNEPANSVYIFLFDAWSYDRTFGNPNWLNIKDFPALNGFLGQATLYTQAYSGGIYTLSALPRLFYPTESFARTNVNTLVQALSNNQFPSEGMSSIFNLTDTHYKSAVGFYVFYPGLLGQHADFYGTYWMRNTGLIDQIRTILYTQVSFLNKFGINMSFMTPSPMHRFIEFQRHTRPVMRRILNALPYRTFAFFQLPFPHGPFAFNPDGTTKQVIKHEGFEALEDYMLNTQHIDVILDDVIHILKQRGDFDSSMIVLMSDHVWAGDREDFVWIDDSRGIPFRHITPDEKEDINPRSPSRHVPLIIKYPHQSTPAVVTNEVDIPDLYLLFQKYFTGDADLSF